MAPGYSDNQKNARPSSVLPKPPKIDLLSEAPRRESLVEQQLSSMITRPTSQQQQQLGSVRNQSNQQQFIGASQGSQPDFEAYPQTGQQQQISFSGQFNQSQNQNYISAQLPFNRSSSGVTMGAQFNQQRPVTTKITTTIKTVTTTDSADDLDQSSSFNSGSNSLSQRQNTHNFAGNQQQLPLPKPILRRSPSPQQPPAPPPPQAQQQLLHETITQSETLSELSRELAEKEAKMKREMAYLNLYYNPWSRPKQIREPRREPSPKSAASERRWIREFPNPSPTSRPNSRASSTRSTTEADLMEKAEQLLRDVEEIERKPIKTQQILIEGGAKGSSAGRFSSNEYDLIGGNNPSVSSIQTKIIRVPRQEVDNKSPLPFSYDNFSTLGVRGNIASVGAAEPETPYPPIFPQIKKSPSPRLR